jgi:hypothetical protein
MREILDELDPNNENPLLIIPKIRARIRVLDIESRIPAFAPLRQILALAPTITKILERTQTSVQELERLLELPAWDAARRWGIMHHQWIIWDGIEQFEMNLIHMQALATYRSEGFISSLQILRYLMVNFFYLYKNRWYRLEKIYKKEAEESDIK